MVCCTTVKLYTTLGCLEHSAAVPTLPGPAEVAALAEAAKQHGTTLQEYLQQQLLAMAWRHPVPGVCGNVLCGRQEGPDVSSIIAGQVGTLCGRCRAAWYCCDWCKREAWAAHRGACSVEGVPR
jgi:hypothetical protein